MVRASLLPALFLVPGLVFGQTTFPLNVSTGARSQATGGQTTPTANASAQGPSAPGPTLITLDQAISLALANNPTLKATRTQIQQNQALETTANLRPNPELLFDSQFVPIFEPGSFSGDTLTNLQQFDIGVSYLFERGR